MALGIAEQQYCRHLHISPEALCDTTLWDSRIINILEKLFNLLQVQGFVPLGFSEQYEGQQETHDKVFYV